MKSLILICTDDIDFYLLLDHVLEVEGFRSVLATGLDETVKVSLEHAPGMVVLDCRPQSFSAIDVFNRLKEMSETESIPIVALISPGAEVDHVQLLKAGIDDAFTRPISPAKLVGRMRGILSGEHSTTSFPDVRLQYADIEMDPTTHRVRRNGKEIHLGPIEFKLLRHLLQTPEQVFSRDELIGAAWPDNVYVGLRTVDVHMGRLRRALKTAAKHDIIRTVRAAGYALSDQTEENLPEAE